MEGVVKEPCSFCKSDPTMAVLCTLMPACTSRKKCISCKLLRICANQAFHEQSFIAEYFKIEAKRSSWAKIRPELQVLVLELRPKTPFAQLKVDLTLGEDKADTSLLVALTPEGREGYSEYMAMGVTPSLFDASGKYTGGRFHHQISRIS